VRIGGHETFYPRPGWLTKGILHLKSGGSGTFSLAETADELGVGRNMAKSIGWWLHALALASRVTRHGPLELTSFGTVVADKDPFMIHLGTWWLLHASAMASGTGTSLPWFFSPGRPERVDRTTLIEMLVKDLSSGKAKPPAIKTVQREVSAIMQSYAVPVPRPRADPEDNLGSPLHRLDLWRHLRAADRFERSEPTATPPEALGLALSALAMNASTHELDEGVLLDVSASSPVLARAGAYFGRSREALLDLAYIGQQEFGAGVISIRALAGERLVSVMSARAATWAERFYNRSTSRIPESA